MSARLVGEWNLLSQVGALASDLFVDFLYLMFFLLKIVCVGRIFTECV
jgi:hypothetical protein